MVVHCGSLPVVRVSSYRILLSYMRPRDMELDLLLGLAFSFVGTDWDGDALTWRHLGQCSKRNDKTLSVV